jgi:hypothetical protein
MQQGEGDVSAVRGILPTLALTLATCMSLLALAQTGPCDRVNPVPLSLYPSHVASQGVSPNLRLKIVNHWLAFDPYAEGELVLQNETGKPISYIGLLVTYEDQEGRPIFTIAYRADLRGSVFPGGLSGAFTRNVLTRAVQPGEVFELTATNLLAGTERPAKAEVAFIGLPHAVSAVSGVAADPDRTDPVLDTVPPNSPDLGSPTQDLPKDALLKLSIDSQGYVERVSFAPDAVPTDPIVTLATDEMKRWRFYPATRDGYAVASDLPILLRFRRGDFPPTRDCFIGQGSKYPKVFAIVTIETNLPGLPEGWQWLYGGVNAYGSAGSLLGQQEIEVTPHKAAN